MTFFFGESSTLIVTKTSQLDFIRITDADGTLPFSCVFTWTYNKTCLLVVNEWCCDIKKIAIKQFITSWTSMFYEATFREILLALSGNVNDYVLWTLNRHAKIFLRILNDVFDSKWIDWCNVSLYFSDKPRLL